MSHEDALARQYLPLARSLARWWARRTGEDTDSLESDATLGMLKGIRGYDPALDTGDHFRLFLSRNITRAVLDGLREREGPLARSRARRTPARQGMPYLLGFFPAWGRLQTADAVRLLLHPLRPKQRLCVVGYILDGDSQVAIGARLGVCGSRVTQIIREGVKVMKRQAERNREAV